MNMQCLHKLIILEYLNNRLSTGGWILLRFSLDVIWTCCLTRTMTGPLLIQLRVPSMLTSGYTGLLCFFCFFFKDSITRNFGHF